LVARGTIKVSHIKDALRRRESLVREIRLHLATLGADGLRLLKDGPFPIGAKAAPRSTSLRRKAPSKARAAWKAQGQYLGAVRRLSKTDRLRVRAIREKSGPRAAIAAAKRMAKG
jgi:hypothetical protein